MTRPKIVCLCGSTRFKPEFDALSRALTLDGHVVVQPGYFGHMEVYPPTEAQKIALDELHLRKIDLADEVWVINKGGYVGESLKSEIAYAIATNKPIVFTEPEAGEKYMQDKADELGQIVARHLLDQLNTCGPLVR